MFIAHSRVLLSAASIYQHLMSRGKIPVKSLNNMKKCYNSVLSREVALFCCDSSLILKY